MRPKHVYLGLCVVGTILPLAAFLPFLRTHDLDLGEFVDQLFATPVSSFFGWDVIVSSMVLWAFVFPRGATLCDSPTLGADSREPAGQGVTWAAAVPVHARVPPRGDRLTELSAELRPAAA